MYTLSGLHIMTDFSLCYVYGLRTTPSNPTPIPFSDSLNIILIIKDKFYSVVWLQSFGSEKSYILFENTFITKMCITQKI